MKDFYFFRAEDVNPFLKKRSGEKKFGEHLSFVNSWDDLAGHPAGYVVFGIPEDIGIRGNFGKPGASTTWNSFLNAFFNIQENRYNCPENCLLLGHILCNQEMDEAEKTMAQHNHPEEKLGALTAQIDKTVSAVVQKIVAAKKIPVIIGGGHNNAFGNIKGTSEALHSAVNILNVDAHTDLRRTDYRHSGNGFSYAKTQQFMGRYAMMGIHKNYTPEYIFDRYLDDPEVYISFYEQLLRPGNTLITEFGKTMAFLHNDFGMEIDCDSIQNFASSAMTPTGFCIDAIRQLIRLAKKQKVHYLHLAEAAAEGDPQIGKALSYFVSDFIR